MKADLKGALKSVLLNGMRIKACSLDRATSSNLMKRIQKESDVVDRRHNVPTRSIWSTALMFSKTELLEASDFSPELLAKQEQTIDEIVDSVDFTELKAQGLDNNDIKLIKLILKAETALIRLSNADDSEINSGVGITQELAEIEEKSEEELKDLAFEKCLTNLVKKYLEKYSSLERFENEEIGDDDLDRQAGKYFKAKFAHGEKLEGFQEETLKHFLDTTFGVFCSHANLAHEISTIFIYHDGTKHRLDEKTFSSVYKNLNDDEKRILIEALSIYIDRFPTK